ncbi:MAG: ChaB family protein [Candidatus Dormibacteraceae bacterium]
MPNEKGEDVPSTIRRSSGKAQRTYKKTLDSAEETYGDGERAHRTAYAALKHSFEKVGDHWEEKQQKGPSDEQASRGHGDSPVKTQGGVDVKGHTRDELEDRAKKLGVEGTSKMKKAELGEMIAKRQ